MQNNSIVSLTGSLRTMNYLEHLDLSYNHLRNLKKILGGIEHLRFLKSLSLVGNPCCEEPGYRIVVLSTITSLNVLDFKVVTDLERQVAVKKHRNSNKKKIGSPVNGSTNNTTVGNTNSGSRSVFLPPCSGSTPPDPIHVAFRGVARPASAAKRRGGGNRPGFRPQRRARSIPQQRRSGRPVCDDAVCCCHARSICSRKHDGAGVTLDTLFR